MQKGTEGHYGWSKCALHLSNSVGMLQFPSVGSIKYIYLFICDANHGFLKKYKKRGQKKSVGSSDGRNELESESVQQTGLLSCTQVELERKHRKWSMGTFFEEASCSISCRQLKSKEQNRCEKRTGWKMKTVQRLNRGSLIIN